MTRKEFIQLCGILGVGLPLPAMLMSCDKTDSPGTPFAGRVTIIGAGAGGLSAGYLLQQQGIDFEILEASASYGGRMKIDTTFADFPIPLGAEWLETGAGVFQEIVNDPAVTVNVETIADAPDRKFVNYSWFNFFEEYIVPSIADKIVYNTPVSEITYAGNQVEVLAQNGLTYLSDKVIVAVPLKMLQDQRILFTPALPTAKLEAIQAAPIWSGFKAFIEFSEKFYPDNEYEFAINPSSDGQKIYYNAALGQNTNKHIMGLFVVGKPALDYTTRSGEALKNHILQELDGIYANQATLHYVKHLTQNWDDEPFIGAGYLSDEADWRKVRTLGEAVANKVYFAGGAYTDGEDWVSVHVAAQSAKSAVAALVG